jgi:CheY-like chemotaxis protein
MTLHCPHCGLPARYAPANVFGESVICPACHQYFPWLDAADHAQSRATATILLAEDDDMQRLLAQRLLEGLGYRVIAAIDGHQALLLFGAHEHEIDLILSDMEMPIASGGELYRAVRSLNERVKFVLVSASPTEEMRGVPFIQKPWTLAQLGQVLREALAA